MTRLTTRSSASDFRTVIERREPFKTRGSLYAEKVTVGSWTPRGRLPQKFYESLWGADYIVYSYGTPIAWHRPVGGWEFPDESYSKTTTSHQTKIGFIKEWL